MHKIHIGLFALALAASPALAQPGHGPISGGGGGGGGAGDVVGPASATDECFARWDTTTGKLLQNSVVCVTDAGLVTGVARLDVDNLRLDGNTLSTTNSNGDLLLAPNGVGSVDMPTGTAANPAITFDDDDTGIYGSSGGIAFAYNGGLKWYWLGNDLNLYDNAMSLTFRGAALAIYSPAASIMSLQAGPGNETVAKSWWADAGKRGLASDFTSQSATPANLTALTTTLITGRKYNFQMMLRFADSTAADGARFDFDGGTATATDFGVNCQVFDTALLLSQDATALATDIVATTTTGASKVICDGSFIVNAAGTFIPRAGQEAASGGTLTVEAGSYLHIWDASFN